MRWVVETYLAAKPTLRIVLITPQYSVLAPPSTTIQYVNAITAYGNSMGIPIINMFTLGGVNAEDQLGPAARWNPSQRHRLRKLLRAGHCAGAAPGELNALRLLTTRPGRKILDQQHVGELSENWRRQPATAGPREIRVSWYARSSWPEPPDGSAFSAVQPVCPAAHAARRCVWKQIGGGSWLGSCKVSTASEGRDGDAKPRDYWRGSFLSTSASASNALGQRGLVDSSQGHPSCRSTNTNAPPAIAIRKKFRSSQTRRKSPHARTAVTPAVRSSASSRHQLVFVEGWRLVRRRVWLRQASIGSR